MSRFVMNTKDGEVTTYINKFETLHVAPVGTLELMVDLWKELLSNKLINPRHIPMFGNSPVIVCRRMKKSDKGISGVADGPPIGFIHYWVSKETAQFNIALGGVHSHWRDLGVYTAMWEELLYHARAEEMVAVVGATNPNNTAMKHRADKLGRKLDALTYIHLVRPEVGDLD